MTTRHAAGGPLEDSGATPRGVRRRHAVELARAEESGPPALSRDAAARWLAVCLFSVGQP